MDFGFAHLGESSVALSSAVSGTMGFMPPEQLLNHPLTTASDLYSLGVTLICLLTRTKSSEVSHLFDLKTFNIQFKQHLLNCDRRFIGWLKQMIARNPQDRFPNAKSALSALRSITSRNENTSLWRKKYISLGVSLSLFILGCVMGLRLSMNQRYLILATLGIDTLRSTTPEMKNYVVIDAQGDRYRSHSLDIPKMTDYTLSADIEIEHSYRSDRTGWAGFFVGSHLPNALHRRDNGYLCFIRENGEIGIHSSIYRDIPVQKYTNTNGSQSQTIRIIGSVSTLQFYLNDVLLLERHTPATFEGYISLNVGGVKVIFSNLKIE